MKLVLQRQMEMLKPYPTLALIYPYSTLNQKTNHNPYCYSLSLDVQGGPNRMQHLRSIISKNLGTEWKICVHYCVWNSFPSKMTSRTLVLNAFWFYGRFSDAMSFSRFALLSQKSQFTNRKFSIVWLPRVKCLLLLCKAKPAWIKRIIHYVSLQHYNPGELLKEIPPYLKRDFWYKRSQFWKWHCLRKMALESKCLYQNP